jgi:translation initiation factor IF-3
MIRISPVRVIDEYGEQAGVMETSKALEMAKERGLDLVEISPKTRPPVCKIIDWGKYQYIQAKKKSENRKSQKKVEVKGVRFRPGTGEGDLEFKLKQAEKFLGKGNKVKIQVILKGREKAHSDIAKAQLKEFIDKINFPVKIEQEAKQQGNGFNVLIAPND